MITIGIVGLGVIGGIMKKYLEIHNPHCQFLISDPQKGFNDNLAKSDIIFISIHIPTEPDGTQDLGLLKSIIASLPDKPIFIRTTLLPGTCDNLSQKFNKEIYFMPEFLTERTAYEDFCSQPMIFTGQVDLLREIFKDKEFIIMNNLEAEIAKYTHNVFGALKVTYFNGIYNLCQKKGIDYNKVQKGALLSGYINEMYTKVPGPDGKLGYGGKCFPKDVNAFSEYLKNDLLCNLLEAVQQLNNEVRNNLSCLCAKNYE